MAFAVEGDDQGETDGDFGSGDGDDEEHHHLSIQVVPKMGKGHESEVGGVEHEFQPHVHHNQVAADDHTEQSEAEEHHADD